MPKRRAKKREPDYPTSIRLKLRIRDLLRADADEQQRSVSWLIAEILEQWYAFRVKQKKHKELMQTK